MQVAGPGNLHSYRHTYCTFFLLTEGHCQLSHKWRWEPHRWCKKWQHVTPTSSINSHDHQRRFAVRFAQSLSTGPWRRWLVPLEFWVMNPVWVKHGDVSNLGGDTKISCVYSTEIHDHLFPSIQGTSDVPPYFQELEHEHVEDDMNLKVVHLNLLWT